MSLIEIDLQVTRAGFRLDTAFTTEGPWVGVIGASGAGKSTLLSAVAGLIPSRGRVRVGEYLLQDSASGLHHPPRRRRTGYLFQGESLFPHLSVRSNLAFGMAGEREAERDPHFIEVVEVLDLAGLLARAPGSLSGGERRRVELGRALLRAPVVLLLDEPLVGLDPALRGRILDYLGRLRDRFGTPTLLVSHQLEDVLTLADEVVVLERGRVRTRGAPRELLRTPDRSALERLMGFDNVIEVVLEEAAGADGTRRARAEGGVVLHLPPCALAGGSRVRVGLRSEDILIARRPPGPTSARNLLPGRITDLRSAGGSVTIMVACGPLLAIKVTPAAVGELDLTPDRKVWVLFKTYSCHYLDLPEPALPVRPTR